ncbi:hypothetical protein [Nevskia ramosa]|uniref:hypothetical protein n=1 Tax=Nevskia ramosa TaxID=64002 RepID=UPI0003B438EA|nr:hypothetical protein [Nevskia ramosa]
MVTKTVIESDDLPEILQEAGVRHALSHTTVPDCYLDSLLQVVIEQGVSDPDALKLAIRFSMNLQENLGSRSNCQGPGCPVHGILVLMPDETPSRQVDLIALNGTVEIKDALFIADVAGCYLQALRGALVSSAQARNYAPASVDALVLLFSLNTQIDVEGGGNCQGPGCPKQPKVDAGPSG